VVVLFPPPQSYVPPPLAVNSTELVLHVSVALVGEMAATGGVLLCVTITDAAAVQPLASVTVTE